MNNSNTNLLLAFLMLFTVLLSTTSHQLSLTSNVYGKSDNANGGNSDDKGSNGNGPKDHGSDGDDGSNNKNVEPNENNGENLVSQAKNQTVEGKNEGKVFYVLIENLDNKINFVPDKVTLTSGFRVVWLNNDNSDHSITVESGSKSEYPLFSSHIPPKGSVDYEFQSAGTYSYSDLDSRQSDGIITILDNAGDQDAISKPLKGIEIILPSFGMKE